MRNLIRVLTLGSVLALPGCGGGGSDGGSQPAQLGEEFVLGHGETAEAGPLLLKFVALVEDSRCPVNLMCVRAGNARIVLSVTSGTRSDLIELGIPEGPRYEVFDGHVIELRDVDPLPVHPGPPPGPGSYRVTLVVDGQATLNGG